MMLSVVRSWTPLHAGGSMAMAAGTLACWLLNSAGTGLSYCFYHICQCIWVYLAGVTWCRRSGCMQLHASMQERTKRFLSKR